MDTFEILQAAASQDPSRAQDGFKGLQTIQKRPGVFADILAIAANKSFAPDVRKIAIIQFKNVATNQWRQRSILNDDHRLTIRQCLLTFFDEQDDTIAQTSALIIAKLFRIDSTKLWPELLPSLALVIQTNAEARFATSSPSENTTLMLRRALSVLNQVLKEIAGLRLPAGVQLMAQVVKDTYPFLTEKYARFGGHLLASISPGSIASAQLASDTHVSHLLFKCLSKTMTWLWTRPGSKGRSVGDDQLLSSFFSYSATQFKNLFDLRVKLLVNIRNLNTVPSPMGVRTIDFLTRHTKAFGKLFRKMEQPAIQRFVTLHGANELVLYYWSQVVDANNGPAEYVSDGTDAVYPIPILLQGMLMFKDCLGQWTPTKQTNIERGNPLLGEQFITQAVQLIVTRLLPLKPIDLENWEGDPEEWVINEVKDGEAWEFDIRTCAERVLMNLVDRYREYVTPILMNALSTVLNAPPSLDLQDVLRKEAIYFSIGGYYNRLRKVIDLNQLLTAFELDAKNSSATYRILKRRIAWLLGKSAPEEASPQPPEPSRIIWDLLSQLLRDRSESSDVAVRLSAAIAIRERVDCLAFDIDAFNPCLPDIVSALMELIAEVDLLESKTRIARTLNTVIQANASRMNPFMSIVTNPIPQLWASSADDYLFKAALLDTIKQLVEATREQSLALQYIVVPMVQESLKPELILHLDQDGLDLWLAALRNTNALSTVSPGSPSLIDLAPTMIRLLGENLDLLGTIVSLFEAYLLLDTPGLLRLYGVDVFHAISVCIGQAIPANVKELLEAVEIMIQLSHSSLWANPMFQSGFFKQVLDTILTGKGSADMNNAYIYVFARAILSDTTTFLQMLSAIPNEDASKLLDKLLDHWWRQFDNMGDPRRRKLTAMAIASLVATGRFELLKRLSGEIFNLWLDVLGEMKEALSSDPDNHLTLYWHNQGGEIPDSMMKNAHGTLEETRRTQSYRSDPVQSTLLAAYLRDQMAMASQNTAGGPDVFNGFIAQADPLVVEQMMNELKV